MRAIQIHNVGGPEVMTLRELPDPVPGPGQLVMETRAVGVNFVDVDTLLQRGDGFVGFRGHRSDTIFSHLYEGGAYLNVRLMDNCRLRAGYNLVWAVDVADATGQLDFNLANPAGRTNNHSSILYYGPSVELSILF